MRLRRKFSGYKKRAIALRRDGNSYADIRAILGVAVPQSTLSEWLSDISMSAQEKEKLAFRLDEKLKIARARSIEVQQLARDKYREGIRQRVSNLPYFLKDKNIAKIALAMIYWCEGA